MLRDDTLSIYFLKSGNAIFKSLWALKSLLRAFLKGFPVFFHGKSSFSASAVHSRCEKQWKSANFLAMSGSPYSVIYFGVTSYHGVEIPLVLTLFLVIGAGTQSHTCVFCF